VPSGRARLEFIELIEIRRGAAKLENVKVKVRPEMVDSGATDVDAIIIGAGFAGLRALYELRRLGLTVKLFEAGSDVGGTWYWNRYPGARTDSEAWAYCYSFSEELQDEWVWPERMPTWDQVLAYLRHVADRFDMRKDIQFDTRIRSAAYDESMNSWLIVSEKGHPLRSRYLVTATGLLTVPLDPPFKGLETFAGEKYLSSRWPNGRVDLKGKRVAMIGSGSTAVQILPVIAHTAAHVTMFQRTPNYVLPGRNHPLDEDQREGIRAHRHEIWNVVRNQVFAFPIEPANRTYESVPPERRRAIFEAGWEDGGFRFVFGTFDDLLVNETSNAAAAEFIRDKIRAIVKDPKTASLLCPTYPFGLKRPPLGNFYYESFNRPNVSLVDVSKNPILEITPTGLRTRTEEYEFDVLVFALGFDAMTGALTHMDIRGRNGQTIRDKWSAGPRTHLGITVDGFPNFFMISGPHTPFANVPPIIDGTVSWIGRAIRSLREGGYESIEATPEAVQAWGRHIQDLLDATLLGKGTEVNSWFLGANVPGKAHAVLFYFGGAAAYFQELEDSVNRQFAGFTRARVRHEGARIRGG
jgi:cation diffusion facilitator CzcD-associated flavoprotein CzcO